MVVNPCKAKKATNMRAAGSDDNIKLAPAKVFTLEEALEFIDDDKLVKIIRTISDSGRNISRSLREEDSAEDQNGGIAYR